MADGEQTELPTGPKAPDPTPPGQGGQPTTSDTVKGEPEPKDPGPPNPSDVDARAARGLPPPGMMAGDQRALAAQVSNATALEAEGRFGALAVATPQQLQSEMQAFALKWEFMFAELVPGVDYGVPTGANMKPFLYQAGADRLMSLPIVNLMPETIVEHFDGVIERESEGKTRRYPTYRCRATTRLIHRPTGFVVHPGVPRTASTQESKFMGRMKWGDVDAMRDTIEFMARKRSKVSTVREALGITGRIGDEEEPDKPGQAPAQEAKGRPARAKGPTSGPGKGKAAAPQGHAKGTAPDPNKPYHPDQMVRLSQICGFLRTNIQTVAKKEGMGIPLTYGNADTLIKALEPKAKAAGMKT